MGRSYFYTVVWARPTGWAGRTRSESVHETADSVVMVAVGSRSEKQSRLGDRRKQSGPRDSSPTERKVQNKGRRREQPVTRLIDRDVAGPGGFIEGGVDGEREAVAKMSTWMFVFGAKTIDRTDIVADDEGEHIYLKNENNIDRNQLFERPCNWTRVYINLKSKIRYECVWYY